MLQNRMVRSKVSPILLTLCLTSCGGQDSATSPTGPPPTTLAPLPTPAPTPVPINEKPDTYCVPMPPPVFGFKLKVHSDRGWKKILDARAIVGPDADHRNWSSVIISE